MEYIHRLNQAEKFEEANDDKACKFYSYQRVVESHIGKECKPEGYQRTACVDLINYNISNEELWVQSEKASSQHKNKHSFRLF